MKKMIFFTASLVFFLFLQQIQAQKYFGTQNYNPSYRHLVLAHPTAYNLRTFVNLIEKEMIQLENTRIVGVFHEKERYNYSKTQQYLDTCKSIPAEILLHKLADPISENELYRFNSLTDDFKAIFKSAEGVVFFGGPDMPPGIYGEQTSLLTSIYDPYRHYFEISFLYHLTGGKQTKNYVPLLEENREFLIYGFCLGMQSMNVAAGGSMYQDIPTEIYQIHFAEEVVKLKNDQTHRNYYRHISTDDELLSGSFHRILINAGSLLDSLADSNPSPMVYSNHHQCVDELGLDYKPMAYSMDNKIVEAIRHEKYPNVIGVQFHPEAMRLYNTDILFKLRPDGALEKGFEILKGTQSFEFHKAYWKDFSRRFNALK
jgi:putative glutamine amidotransferase